jgi:hypothetical protein
MAGELELILPTDSPETISRLNAKAFCNWYKRVISSPITLSMPAGSKTYCSGNLAVQARYNNLYAYLRFLPDSSTVYDWGRTILSEIVIHAVAAVHLSFMKSKQDMQVLLTTTDLDASSKGRLPHKGMDVLYVKRENGFVLPFFGVDITIDNGWHLERKRKKLGMHSELGIPVVVLNVRDFSYTEPDGAIRDFAYYLDHVVRPGMLKGDFDCFKGLNEENIREWLRLTNTKLLEAVNICDHGLDRVKGIEDRKKLKIEEAKTKSNEFKNMLSKFDENNRRIIV